jgi:hypothetical protein
LRTKIHGVFVLFATVPQSVSAATSVEDKPKEKFNDFNEAVYEIRLRLGSFGFDDDKEEGCLLGCYAVWLL